MANTQAVCTSFKGELLNGIHAFGTSVIRASSAADVFKGAIYLASATLNASTTIYSSTGEASGTNYVAGGNTVVWIAPATSGTTAFSTLNANMSWTNVTLATAFDTVFLYNTTQSNKAIAVYTFSSQTITAGNFTLVMPTNDATTGLLRLA